MNTGRTRLRITTTDFEKYFVYLMARNGMLCQDAADLIDRSIEYVRKNFIAEDLVYTPVKGFRLEKGSIYPLIKNKTKLMSEINYKDFYEFIREIHKNGYTPNKDIQLNRGKLSILYFSNIVNKFTQGSLDFDFFCKEIARKQLPCLFIDEKKKALLDGDKNVLILKPQMPEKLKVVTNEFNVERLIHVKPVERPIPVQPIQNKVAKNVIVDIESEIEYQEVELSKTDTIYVNGRKAKLFKGKLYVSVI